MAHMHLFQPLTKQATVKEQLLYHKCRMDKSVSAALLHKVFINNHTWKLSLSMPWRHIGEHQYTSTHSETQH
jgi:hypothetical protein